jgi:hypothetical protein
MKQLTGTNRNGDPGTSPGVWGELVGHVYLKYSYWVLHLAWSFSLVFLSREKVTPSGAFKKYKKNSYSYIMKIVTQKVWLTFNKQQHGHNSDTEEEKKYLGNALR